MTEQRLSAAIMQPYFLPYLGYFALIQNVDLFVILDSVQYPRRGWMNRNRLPNHPNARDFDGEWTYFGFPIEKAPRSELISNIRISYSDSWQETLKKTLTFKYSKSPYFTQVWPLLDPIWEQNEFLVDLNESLLKNFCSYLGLSPRWIRSSTLVREHPHLRDISGSELILQTALTVGATDYWNLPGGRELYDPATFSASGMTLNFLPQLDVNQLKSRDIQANAFTILDLAMNLSPSKIRKLIT